MAVYVDNLSPCIQNIWWKHNESCHMFGDDENELHKIARCIGLKKRWFQNKNNFPHYDLTRNKRVMAINAGAKEVDSKFMVRFMQQRR